MRQVLICSAIIFVFLGSSHIVHAASAPSTALTARCESCHGDQVGTKPDAARLNGLSSDYLFARLKAFANPIDQSPHAIDNMWSVIINMSDSDKRQLADYFANQAVPAAKLNGPALGRNLYERGLPAQGAAGMPELPCSALDGEGAVYGLPAKTRISEDAAMGIQFGCARAWCDELGGDETIIRPDRRAFRVSGR